MVVGRGGGYQHTIIIPQDEDKDRLQAKQTQEIPRQTRHPPHIEITRHHARLQHALEANRQGERQLQNHISGEKGVDPAHDQRLRDHHRHVALHHAHHALHGGGVGHWIGGRFAARFGPVAQEGAGFVGGGEVAAACFEGGRREGGGGVVAEIDAAEEGETFAGFRGGGGRFGRGGHQDAGVVAEDAGEDLGRERVGGLAYWLVGELSWGRR